MKTLSLSPLVAHPSVEFSGKKITLPHDIQQKIDAYWEFLLTSGKSYTRGEVFTATHKEVRPDGSIHILVEKTDYAHYLYCQNVDPLGERGVHIIHTAVFVETADNQILFGKMGPQTSRAGIYQLCGGGIDNDDLRGAFFDLDHNIQKELGEELGINTNDQARVHSFGPAYLKEGGLTDKIAVIYRVQLNETSAEFQNAYTAFAERLTSQGEQPEFEEIIALKKDNDAIDQFFTAHDLLADDYMRPLFELVENSEHTETHIPRINR